MSDITSPERATSLLDAFASREQNLPAVSSGQSVPADVFGQRAFGAQRVAIRRDPARILDIMRSLAASAGERYYYRYPVKSGGATSYIEGPSIALANDLAREYGNLSIDTKVVDIGTHWMIYARVTDYETGSELVRPFQQRKSQKTTGDADRQQDIALQIGASKAIRNVVVNFLQTYADFAYEEARGSLVAAIGKDLAKWREKARAGIEQRQIALPRVERVIGRPLSDWLAADVAKVRTMLQGIDEGMATLDETFPPLPAAEAAPEPEKPATDAQEPAAAPVAPAAPEEPPTTPAPLKTEVSEETTATADADAQDRAREAGSNAALNGKKRISPKGLSPAEAEAWFDGYDTRKLELDGGADA